MSVHVGTRGASRPLGLANQVTHDVRSAGAARKTDNSLRSNHVTVKNRKPQSAGSTRREPSKDHEAVRQMKDEGDGDIRFINIPAEANRLPQTAWLSVSRPASAASVLPSPRHIRHISAQQILDEAQEDDHTKVYEIDLHSSNITEIKNLEKFTKVRVLDLSSNHIAKIQNLHCNTELREVKLYGNQICEIQNLENLKELCHMQLQHNRISTVGKGLTALRKLKLLRLDHNRLSKLDARQLASCSLLTYLDLSSNRLTNISAVNCLPNLEELYVANNQLTAIPDLSRCKKLQEVDVSNNELTDLSGFKGLSSLRILHVHHNALTSLNSLGKHKCLDELFASDNRLTELSQIPLLLPALQILDVSHNYVEDFQQFVHLRGLGDLVELTITDNPCLQENGLHYSLSSELHMHMPSLEYLNGMQLKRPSSQPSTPLMRPMSAASVVSSRQVENQIKALEQEMGGFEATLAEKFDNLRSGLSSLAAESPRSAKSEATAVTTKVTTTVTESRSSSRNSLTTPASERPKSRSGKRSRIEEAQQFAAQHF